MVRSIGWGETTSSIKGFNTNSGTRRFKKLRYRTGVSLGTRILALGSSQSLSLRGFQRIDRYTAPKTHADFLFLYVPDSYAHATPAGRQSRAHQAGKRLAAYR
jgi:hypothetical protein